MSKTITKVVVIIATLALVAIGWTFTLGPNGAFKTVGKSLAEKVDTVFEGVGLETELADMWTTSFGTPGKADGKADIE